MAEIAAAVGLAASIVTLIEISSKVATRLQEFSVKTGEVPESFRMTAQQLPLLLVTLKKLRLQAESGNVDPQSIKAIQPVIDNTIQLTKSLETIIAEFVPEEKSSTFKRRVLALKSLSKDRKVQDHLTQLKDNLQILVFYQTTQVSDRSTEILGAISQLQIGTDDKPPRYDEVDFGVSLEGVFMLPFRRDKNFVERDTIDEVAVHLNESNSRVAIVGLGGCGKSQIAIEHCYRVHEEDPQIAVFWIHAGSFERVQQDFHSIAQRLRIPGREDPQADTVALVCRRLSEEANTKWLLVVDNADDSNVVFGDTCKDSGPDAGTIPMSLAESLPVNDLGSILITSRSWDVVRTLVDEDDICSLGPLSSKDAVKMFQAKLSKRVKQPTETEVNHLMCNLEYLPLAICQAVALINQRAPRMDVAKYVHDFEKSEHTKFQLLETSFRDARRDISISSSIFASFQITFNTIRETKPSAAALLSFMSMFDRAGIQETLLHGQYLDSTSSTDDSLLNFDDDVAVLQSYELIHSKKDDVLEMHALVQLSVRHWLHQFGSLRMWQHRMIRVLGQALPRTDIKTWEIWSSMLPHVKTMENWRPEGTDSDILLEWSRILHLAARYLLEHDRLSEAESTATKSLDAIEKVSNIEPRELLRAKFLLAKTGFRMGKKEALTLFKEVLESRVKAFGIDDPDTMASFILKAQWLEDKGEFAEADSILRRILKSPSYTPKLEMMSCCVVESQLAWMLSQRGDFDDAANMIDRAITVSTQLMGSNHQETVRMRSYRAFLYCRQNQVAKAEKYIDGLMQETKEAYSLDHPVFTEIRKANMVALNLLGRTSESLSLSKEILEREERVYGLESKQTALAMRIYAVNCSQVGDYESAELWLRRAVDIRMRKYGPQHAETVRDKAFLAGTMMVSADRDEKETLDLLKDVVQSMEAMTEPKVPELLRMRSHLAQLYRETGKLEDATNVARAVVEQARLELGEGRTELAEFRIYLAQFLAVDGQDIEARKLYDESHGSLTSTLGKEHQLVKSVELGWTAVEKLIEAKRLIREGRNIEAQSVFEESVSALQAYQSKHVKDSRRLQRYREEFEDYARQRVPDKSND